MTQLKQIFVVVLVGTTVSACAARDVPVVIGQAAVALTESIGELQRTTKELTDASVLPVSVAREVQVRLLQANAGVEKAIPYLETLDKAVQAGQEADPNVVSQALAILTSVSTDLSVVLTGVPLNETTQTIVDLVRAAQQAVANTLIEVAKLKGAQ